MSDKKFEIVRETFYKEKGMAPYKVPVYKCLNCGSEDIKEIHGHCECHLCEDWGGCRDPYPLIARRCQNCGAEEVLRIL